MAVHKYGYGFVISYILIRNALSGTLVSINGSLSWEEAGAACEQTGGRLARLNVLDNTVLDSIQTCLPQSGSAWIDEVTPFTPWLSILGCKTARERNVSIHIDVGKPSVSVCYDLCKNGSDVFGVQGNACFCGIQERSEVLDNDTTCTDPCEGVFCGGNTTMTVYKKHLMDPADTNRTCMAMKCNESALRRRPCNDLYPPACFHEGSENLKENKTWAESIEFCLKSANRFPETIFACTDKNRNGFFWTGTFRIRQTDHSLVKSLKRSLNHTVVETDRSVNETKSVLCVIDGSLNRSRYSFCETKRERIDTGKTDPTISRFPEYHTESTSYADLTRSTPVRQLKDDMEPKASYNGDGIFDEWGNVITGCAAFLGVIVLIFLIVAILQKCKRCNTSLLKSPDQSKKKSVMNAMYSFRECPPVPNEISQTDDSGNISSASNRPNDRQVKFPDIHVNETFANDYDSIGSAVFEDIERHGDGQDAPYETICNLPDNSD